MAWMPDNAAIQSASTTLWSGLDIVWYANGSDIILYYTKSGIIHDQY